MNTQYRLALGLGLAPSGLAGVSTTASACGLTVDPAKLDTNRDVMLSRSEVRGTPLFDVFDQLDDNRSGFIELAEYKDRCQLAAKQPATTGWESVTEAEGGATERDPTIVEEKLDKQADRQSNKLESRVDKEADNAADKFFNKLFGD
jgi:hypothetical protein